MSLSGVMNDSISKSSTRNIRRVEAPRPLKKTLSDTKSYSSPLPRVLSTSNIESVETLVIFMDTVVETISLCKDPLNNPSGDTTTALTDNIVQLCKQMKIFGSQLEKSYQDQLDRACAVFRSAIIRGSLEYQALKCILDVLESRKCLWNTQESPANFSSASSNENDMSELKNYVKTHSIDSSAEILGRSNLKTSKPANKNYIKDEIVIRNSDSGKVMPTAKERLVQITGAHKASVESATRLIRETIRNNASPIKELLPKSNSSSSSVESFSEQSGCDEFRKCESESSSFRNDVSGPRTNNESYLYKHKILLSNCELTITGDDYTYVTVAKAVLDDYFSKLQQSAEVETENNNRVVPNDLNGTKKSSPKSDLNGTKKSSLKSVFGASFALQSEPSNVLETHEPFSATILPENELFPENIPVEYAEISSSNNVEEMWPNIVPSTEYTGLTNTHHISDEIALADIVVDNTLNSADNNPTASPEEVPIIYTKEFMLKCRSSESSQQKPKDWDHILSKFPDIVKTSDDPINVEEYICEDVNE